ncbi:sporulation initiation phosphotransferase F [Kroppenstedtia guangzhouensis]|uniref:Sporulation initiation phosphotransferase F n=1 Tax=Kroppenstedtia guangzhouensis TaxID=1274356 RepID=A0ABQ1GM17_9BACL|nr:response regulator [Kroppenstedtia guangzhouensis]GGA46067.1 sporulation initiation phosphotransferase F [Kroppenstedtia guangzhouensis]
MSLSDKKVLVVDDQYGIRILLTEVFSREGMNIFQAANGKLALELIRKENPDLILLDMKMPGMDGLELLRQLKKEQMDVIVIMMTAYGELDMVEEATKLGARAHFTKPFDIMELRTEVIRQLTQTE